MITGHLAVTLVAKTQKPDMPWWMLIVASFLIDIVMFTLIALGIEKMAYTEGFSGPTMSGAIIETTFSHDLLPQIFWIALTGVLFYILTRKLSFAIVAMALTLVHWLSDLVSGYGHFIWGPESQPLGTDWYHTNMFAAASFEVVLSVACVYWFVRKSSLSTGKRAVLFAVFAIFPFTLILV